MSEFVCFTYWDCWQSTSGVERNLHLPYWDLFWPLLRSRIVYRRGTAEGCWVDGCGSPAVWICRWRRLSSPALRPAVHGTSWGGITQDHWDPLLSAPSSFTGSAVVDVEYVAYTQKRPVSSAQCLATYHAMCRSAHGSLALTQCWSGVTYYTEPFR